MSTPDDFRAWLTHEMARYAWSPAHVARWVYAEPAEVERWLSGEAVPELDQLRCLSGIARADLFHLLKLAGWLRDKPIIPHAAQTERQ